MKYLLSCLLICGCSTFIPEAERIVEDVEIGEAERVEKLVK